MKKRERVAKTPILMQFAKSVRTERIKQQISQERLAELADLHPTYISNIEQGDRNLSMETAYRIGKALGVPLAKLVDFGEYDI